MSIDRLESLFKKTKISNDIQVGKCSYEKSGVIQTGILVQANACASEAIGEERFVQMTCAK